MEMNGQFQALLTLPLDKGSQVHMKQQIMYVTKLVQTFGLFPLSAVKLCIAQPTAQPMNSVLCSQCILQGTQYYIWKLSDLRESLKTFSLFLFRAAASEMWKLNEGAVIAVLNPSILDNRYVCCGQCQCQAGSRCMCNHQCLSGR